MMPMISSRKLEPRGDEPDRSDRRSIALMSCSPTWRTAPRSSLMQHPVIINRMLAECNDFLSRGIREQKTIKKNDLPGNLSHPLQHPAHPRAALTQPPAQREVVLAQLEQFPFPIVVIVAGDRAATRTRAWPNVHTHTRRQHSKVSLDADENKQTNKQTNKQKKPITHWKHHNKAK
jgi:hypothetical protein